MSQFPPTKRASSPGMARALKRSSALTPLNPESTADTHLTAAFIVDLTLQKRR